MDKRQKSQLSRWVKEGDALGTLEGFEGWHIVKKHIDDGIESAKENVFSSKHVKNWNDYLQYKASFNTLNKLLAVIEAGKLRGDTARKKLEKDVS